MERLQVFSFCYTTFVAFATIVVPQDIEIYARIFMYLTAGILSLITTFYVVKNKGKKAR